MQDCINSWSIICPDYEVIEWNESNFNINQHPFLKYCYDNKKYAFLSDFARLLIVYDHGGIYFDTDVELIKKPDDLLNCHAFFAFENNEYVATGLGFGAEKNNNTLRMLINSYLELKAEIDGSYTLISCPELNTKALLPLGLIKNGKKQTVGDAIILPADYMNPYDDPTGRLNVTENTISIHWYSKSWLSKSAIFRSKLTKPLHRIFGVDCFRWFKR